MPVAAPPAPLAYLDGTLVTLAAKYIDPKRFDVRRMLRGALDGLERDVPEVIAESAADRVTVRVSAYQRTFAVDITTLGELGARLGEIVRFVQAHANAGTARDEIELHAVNGMLRTLDPHTFILSAKEMADWNINVGGKFGGVGLVIGMRNQRITVEHVLAQAPAERAGIEVGDAIAAINGHATAAFTLDEALERLRGEPGSTLELVVERRAATLVVPLTRAEIRVPAVASRLLDGKVGYVGLAQFAPDTADELARAMAQLRARGARAWVVDLRENAGGYLSQAVTSADLFVDDGTIVATVAGGKQHDVRRATPGGDTQRPVVVLVNERTASSAEILAGALKQLDRAVVVGRRTFGKGSIQVLEGAAHGAKLEITTAEYVAANDVSPQGGGIVPDVELVPAQVPAQITEHAPLRLVPAPPVRELDFGAHLAPTQRQDADEPLASIRYRRVDTDDPAQDFEVGFARDVALAIEGRSRRDGLKRLPRVIARASTTAERGLARALRQLGIDWARGASTAKLALKFDDAVTAATGAVVPLRGEVTNLGTTPSFRVHARARSDDPALDGLEMAFGVVPPRATKQATARVRLPASPAARTSTITWKLESGEATTRLAIAATPFPDFALAAALADDDDGIANANEPLRVRTRVTNRGPGRSTLTVVTLKSLVGERVRVDRGRLELGALEPNQTKDVELVFSAAPAADGRVVLELAVADGTLDTGQAHRLELALGTRVAQQRWELTPPRVHLADVPLETTAARVRVTGTAEDEQAVGDVYVTVSPPGANAEPRKVFYAAGDQPRLAFAADVPLAKGVNRIVVTAREHERAQTVRTLWVVRR